MTPAAFGAVALLSLMAAISPGPAVLMTARVSVTQGMRAGVFIALGIGLAAAAWAAAALSGLAILFRLAPTLLTALKVVGAAYLLWLAWHLWRDADRPVADTGGPTPRTAASAFRLGLVTQLSNPKAVVVFSAIFLGAVPPGTPWQVVAALVAVVFLNETVFNVFVARVFSFERTRSGYLRLKGTIDRCFGGLLALLGVKIAAT